MRRAELPHAAHFIGASRCLFRRATVVGEHVVSTVGEFMSLNNAEMIEVGGPGEFFETMVWRAKPPSADCCLFDADIDRGPLTTRRYRTADEAQRGHEELCSQLEERHELH